MKKLTTENPLTKYHLYRLEFNQNVTRNLPLTKIDYEGKQIYVKGKMINDKFVLWILPLQNPIWIPVLIGAGILAGLGLGIGFLSKIEDATNELILLMVAGTLTFLIVTKKIKF